MKNWSSILGLLAVSVAASGCSSVSGLLDDDPAPQTMSAAAPDLSMPPDLRLPQPGSAPPPAAYEDTQAVASAPPPKADVSTVAATPPGGVGKPEDAAYEKYGVVVYNPDGTRRPDGVLREELRQAIIAEKQQKNPNYGTVFNIGNIFKDE